MTKRRSVALKLRISNAYVLGVSVSADPSDLGLMLGLAHPGGGYFVGWGYDASTPLRPWPVRFATVTKRGYPLVGVVWCGFFVQKSGPRHTVVTRGA